MTWEEFQITRSYVEKKALELMSHEGKNDAVIGVPLDNYKVFKISKRIFYSVQVNTFKVIINEHLNLAQVTTPEMFGTKNARDVLKALHQQHPIHDLEWFEEFLRHEKCTYIFESEGGNVLDRILRIDLFRMIRNDKEGYPEFVGGILHALKHFSKDGIPYSTHKANHQLVNPQHLIGQTIEAFFVVDGFFENENEYTVLKEIDEKYSLKFVFYREANTGVFFLNTVYKESKN
jgi:hypothetical protein